MPRSITPVSAVGVTNASDFHKKFELSETTWKLSLEDSSNTASTVPAVPQSSVMWSVFLLAGSGAAGPGSTVSVFVPGGGDVVRFLVGGGGAGRSGRNHERQQQRGRRGQHDD